MGATAFLIVFILLMGFISNRYSQVKYRKLLQYSGQHLYNKLIFNGVSCFIIALVYCNVVEFWQPGVLVGNIYFKAIDIFSPSLNIIFTPTVVFGLLISVAWALSHDLLSQAIFFVNVPTSENNSDCFIKRNIGAWRKFENYTRHHDAATASPINAQLIHRHPSELAMIFMSDRKVYIGRFESILFSNDFREQLTHCRFIPTKSGYRDKDTLEVSITTEYKARTKDSTDNAIERLSVILKVSDIVSIREYSDEQFEHFLATSKQKERQQKLLDLISIEAKDYLPIHGNLQKK